MYLSSLEILLLAVGSLWFVISPVSTEVRILNGTRNPFPAVLAFGDSILDTGNNNGLPTLFRGDFPPYGKDFVDHQPTGRFCNGRVPSDFIVSILGIKELLPAYLDPKLSSEDLLTGVCFASGASGYDPLTSKLSSAVSLEGQLELFQDYKQKLQTITDPERAAMIVTQSLYLAISGTNDLANTYFTTPFRKIEYDIHRYTSFLADSAATFVENLYNVGARKILVAGLPPVGCLPAERTIAGGIQRDCVSSYNQASAEYNAKLTQRVELLQNKFMDATIVYGDIFEKLLHIIQHPTEYGFEEANKGCCGSGLVEAGVLCNPKSSTCVDASKYVFWDSAHPTERTYQIMTEALVEAASSHFV